MQVLRLKKRTESKIELVNLVLTAYCLFSGVKLNKTELEVLSYFAVYGFRQQTKDLILRSRILRSYNSLENTLSKFRKLGLIKKDADRKDRLIPQLALETKESKIGLIIQLDNA